jgi:eukaryotic-like serine/threonine-protein kinase
MRYNLLFGLLAIAFALAVPTSCGLNSTVASPLENNSTDFQDEPVDTTGAIGLADMNELYQYENSEYDFTVTYPSSWMAEDADENDMGIVAGFLAPSDDMDNPSTYVTMQVEALPAGMNLTLEQYGQAALSSLKEALPELQILEESDIAIGQKVGHAIVYDLNSDGMDFKVLKAWTVEGDEAYIMTYNAPADQYDEFAKDASTIIGSLVVG